MSFVVDLTARQRAERDRAEILARERVARAEADNDRERLTFLLRAGSLVAAAQDRHELLQRACQLVADSLADFCMVFLPDEDGLRATAIAYRDPERGTLSVDLTDEKVPATHRLAVATAYATGTSQLVGDVSAWMADRSEASPILGDILARLETETVLAAPLMADRRPLGVLAVGRCAGRPGFADTDIAVIEELSRRVGVGLANADTSARDHSVAETLQRSVLPDVLPSIAGLDLAVRYIPGTDDIDVGGYWYDAFQLAMAGWGSSSATSWATASPRHRSWARCAICSAPTRSTGRTPLTCWPIPSRRSAGCFPRRWPPPSTRYSTRSTAIFITQRRPPAAGLRG